MRNILFFNEQGSVFGFNFNLHHTKWKIWSEKLLKQLAGCHMRSGVNLELQFGHPLQSGVRDVSLTSHWSLLSDCGCNNVCTPTSMTDEIYNGPRLWLFAWHVF